MVAIKNIVLLATAVTANVIARDYKTINADLTTINSDTVQLTKDIGNYKDINTAVTVQNTYNQLDKDVQNANTDAKNSAALNDSDSQKVIDYVNKTLEPNVAKAITALNNKKSQFTSDGLAGTVCNDLKSLKTDVDNLGASLVAKASSGKQSAAKKAVGTIDTDIQKGITAFC